MTTRNNQPPPQQNGVHGGEQRPRPPQQQPPSSYSNGFNNNHQHPQYYPRTPARSSSSASLKGCCCYLFLLLSFLALLTLAIVLIILLAVKPKKPQFDLQQVGVQYLGITSTPNNPTGTTAGASLSLTNRLLFQAANPNKGWFKYGESRSTVMHRGVPLGKASVPGFYQDAHSVRNVATIDAEKVNLLQADAADFIRDASLNDRVDLRVLGDVGAKIRVMNFDSPNVEMNSSPTPVSKYPHFTIPAGERVREHHEGHHNEWKWLIYTPPIFFLIMGALVIFFCPNTCRRCLPARPTPAPSPAPAPEATSTPHQVVDVLEDS